MKIKLDRRVAQAFDFADTDKQRVPRPLRSLQRAGTTNAYAAGLVQKDKSRVGSIATRPCKERKDGAPPE